MRRIGRILTTERIIWVLVLSIVAALFFYLGRTLADDGRPVVSLDHSSSAVPHKAMTEVESESTEAATESASDTTAADTTAVTRITTSATGRKTTAEETTAALKTRTGGLLDLNTVTKEQLMTIRGIGEAFADRILAYRESHGGFQSVEELKNIDGIGEKRYAQWAPYFTVS